MVDKIGKRRRQWENEIKEVYEQKLKFELPRYTNESGIALKYVYDAGDTTDIETEMPSKWMPT